MKKNYAAFFIYFIFAISSAANKNKSYPILHVIYSNFIRMSMQVQTE